MKKHISAKKQEDELFTLLYEKYYQFLFSVAFQVLGDRQLAEDAVHDTFYKLTDNMHMIKDADSVKTKRYLITITKNASIDIYRKRKKLMSAEVFYDELGSGIIVSNENEENGESEDCGRLIRILMELPVKYRDILLLRYSSGYSYSEISEILGIRETTARQRISRGKELVDKKLKEVMG